MRRPARVVTDSAGQYKIVDLSPGIYEVSFTLTGFKTVRRGNVILEGTVTPTVNAELQVGALDEVLTVTAESPIVDVVNNQQTFVASRDVLDAIPTTRRDTTARALLIPGTTVTPFVLGQYNMTSHGSSTSDFTMAIDGLRVNNLCGSGQYSGFYMNDASVQELTYTTGSESAEMQSSGIRVNSVPKDGGNKFSGSFFVYGQKGCEATATNGCFMAADNRSDAVKAAGITIAGTAYDWQINPSFGGPLVKDKLWFYVTYKYQDNKIYVPSAHFADGSPAYRNGMGNYSGVGRLTWAASSKDKIRVYVEKQFNGEFYNGFNTYADVDARSRRPTRKGAAGYRRLSGRVRSRASCCSKPASPITTSRTRRNCRRGPGADRTAEPEWVDRTGCRARAATRFRPTRARRRTTT